MALPILRTEVLLSALLLFPPVTLKPPVTETPQVEYIQLIQETKKPVPNFDKEVLEPLKVKQEEARIAAESARIAEEKAAEALRAAQEAERPRLLPLPASKSYVAPSVSVRPTGGLMGSLGYIRPGNNCVNTAKAYGKNQPGDPDTWYVTTRTPFIGAAAVFPFKHVAIVVGIWSNGDIEVVHENAPGAGHRFSQSQIKGYF